MSTTPNKYLHIRVLYDWLQICLLMMKAHILRVHTAISKGRNAQKLKRNNEMAKLFRLAGISQVRFYFIRLFPYREHLQVGWLSLYCVCVCFCV